MRPNHNPQILDARPPASLEVFNSNATGAATRQFRHIQNQVAEMGGPNSARLPENEQIPLYGHSITLENGTHVNLELETDANTGELIPADRRFVDARDRLAVARSRERSRGSRLFNFAFNRSRGQGYGHHYQHSRYETEYRTELSSFIARKVTGVINNEPALDDAGSVTEIVSRSVIQEQRQMGALENMAAEHKSRFLNFMRNHKKTRAAVGLALTGISMVGLAFGQLQIALPALAARSAVSATGGYLMGRTGWDAIQGWRSRRQAPNDIRRADAENGDISGNMRPHEAFHRYITTLGAEARAGSRNQNRQELIQRLGSLSVEPGVHEYYTNHALTNPALGGTLNHRQFNFGGGHSAADIQREVRIVHRDTINPLETRRIASDQTQSRARHRAGIIGGVLMGALPIFRGVSYLHLDSLNPFGGDGFLGIGGGGHADHAGQAAHHAANNSGGSSGANNVPDNTPVIGGTNHVAPGTAPGTNGIYGGNGIGSNGVHGANGIGGTLNHNGSNFTMVNGGAGNDTINVNALHEAAGHGGHADHAGAVHHHLHETRDGISTSKLHYEHGDGFTQALQRQYPGLTPSQVNSIYHDMTPSLRTADGTYLQAGEVRISPHGPGEFKLPSNARGVLEDHLRHLHQMHHEHISGHASVDSAHDGGHGHTDGVSAPNKTGINGTATPNTAGSTDVLIVNGGAGNDQINVLMPDAHSPEGRSLQALVDGHYVNETTMGNLTPEQIAQAHELLQHGGYNVMSTGHQQALQHTIDSYVQSSIDHPASSADAHEAAQRIHNTWDAVHHEVHRLSIEQARQLEDDLAIANSR